MLREPRFDWDLLCNGLKIVGKLVLGGADHANTSILELRPSSSAKYLKDVQYSKVNEFSVLCTVYLGWS